MINNKKYSKKKIQFKGKKLTKRNKKYITIGGTSNQLKKIYKNAHNVRTKYIDTYGKNKFVKKKTKELMETLNNKIEKCRKNYSKNKEKNVYEHLNKINSVFEEIQLIVKIDYQGIVREEKFSVKPYEEIWTSCRRELRKIDKYKNIVRITFVQVPLEEGTFWYEHGIETNATIRIFVEDVVKPEKNLELTINYRDIRRHLSDQMVTYKIDISHNSTALKLYDIVAEKCEIEVDEIDELIYQGRPIPYDDSRLWDLEIKSDTNFSNRYGNEIYVVRKESNENNGYNSSW